MSAAVSPCLRPSGSVLSCPCIVVGQVGYGCGRRSSRLFFTGELGEELHFDQVVEIEEGRLEGGRGVQKAEVQIFNELHEYNSRLKEVTHTSRSRSSGRCQDSLSSFFPPDFSRPCAMRHIERLIMRLSSSLSSSTCLSGSGPQI